MGTALGSRQETNSVHSSNAWKRSEGSWIKGFWIMIGVMAHPLLQAGSSTAIGAGACRAPPSVPHVSHRFHRGLLD